MLQSGPRIFPTARNLRWAALCALFLVVFVGIGAAGAQPRDSRDYAVGNWTVSVHRDASNRFLLCAGTVAGSGLNFGFALTASRNWTLLFGDEQEQWSGRQTVQLAWTVKSYRARKAEGANAKGLVIARLSLAAIAEFRSEGDVDLRVHESEYGIEITGAAAVLDALERCVETRGEPGPAASPQARPAPPPTQPQAAPAPPAPSPGRPASPAPPRGTWAVRVSTSPSSGAFVACVAASPNAGSALFGLGLSRDGEWSLYMQHEGWAFADGQAVDLRYRVDRQPARDAAASSYKGKSLRAVLGGRQAVAEIARGYVLLAAVDGRQFEIDLSGSAAAVAEIERCVEGNGGVVRRPPARAAPRLQSSPPSRSSPQGEEEAPAEPQLGEPGFRPSKLFGR